MGRGASWLVVKEKENNVSRLGDEFTSFDGNTLLGLTSLGLKGMQQRHVACGERGGVWQDTMRVHTTSTLVFSVWSGVSGV